MDNNKKLQLNNLEYRNMNTVSPISPLKSIESKVNTNLHEEFKEVMKRKKISAKGKKNNLNSNINEDLIVDNSLRELMKNDSGINKTIEEKVTKSALIKKLLSKEEITPEDKVLNK